MRTSYADLLRRHNPPVQAPTLFPDILDDYERQDGPVSLVLSDVQPGFESCTEAHVDAVIRQVIIAKQRNWWIIVLEWDGFRKGKTHPRILAILEGYARCISWDKGRNTSGAAQVEMSVDDFRYPSRVFRVVGLNTDECVVATVNGMLSRFPLSLIRVIREACNTDTGIDDPWVHFPKVCNLAISSETIDSQILTAA